MSLLLLAALFAAADCKAIENDVARLACYDEQAGPKAAPVAETPTDDPVEVARRAVDLMLATSLVDPLSAIQYRVSAPVPCAKVVRNLPKGNKADECICYYVNGKNRTGGYAGAKLSVAVLLPIGPTLSGAVEFIPPDRIEQARVCQETMADRPSTNITQKVKQ